LSEIPSDVLNWLPAVTQVSSPNFDQRPPRTEIALVVLHAISLPPGQFGGPYVQQLFTNTLDLKAHPYFAGLEGLKVSAHFFIDRGGQLTQFVGLQDRAWHAGESCWAGRTACNDFSIGIELEGCDELPFEMLQYASLNRLLGRLQQTFPQLDASRIVGHSDIAPGRKTDPGPCFDWRRVCPERE
jgi:AmpD protein